jgi:hypothetical protein
MFVTSNSAPMKLLRDSCKQAIGTRRAATDAVLVEVMVACTLRPNPFRPLNESCANVLSKHGVVVCGVETNAEAISDQVGYPSFL